jgi:hypothetical protein
MRILVQVIATLILTGGALVCVMDAKDPASPPRGEAQTATPAQQAQWPQPGSRGEVVPLWPEGVPGQNKNGGPELFVDGRISNVHAPTLTMFRAPASTNTRAAVIICPGGAYSRLAMEREGRATAEWLTQVTGTVSK